ncbi:VOC family protein [Frigidibacter sp. RF13]|uniref:VOC family protein n=1 Tax=Frigidibacter sp. RF13 TaxID=2997340 RepID=UPI00226F0456|nr:VOC family protein [Frigidibacter sp. RF13]MCY1127352.1 VOC family protein [Frigidibacter sp. RF13]
MWELDHLAVTAPTLTEAADHVAAALGVALGPIGHHSHMGTHNRLVGLGPSDYLEAIAIDPEAPEPAWPRWFRLNEPSAGARLTNWICRVPDLDAALSAAPAGAGLPTALARGDFRWNMAVPEDGRLPFDDCFPALLSWQGGLKPPDRLADSGCRLTRLEVAHPEADRLRPLLRLSDARIEIVPGAPALRATFDTPGGRRRLE